MTNQNLLRKMYGLAKHKVNWNGETVDLVYITPRVLVAASPTSVTLAYLLETHGFNWHLWNFQREPSEYSNHQAFFKVSEHAVDDHNPPTISQLQQVCAEVDTWLARDEKNVAVFHCLEGKGRSGTFCCWYLMHQHRQLCSLKSLDDILKEFTKCRMRWFAGQGVSIKSQKRYLQYYTDHPQLVLDQPHYVLVTITRMTIHKCCPTMVRILLCHINGTEAKWSQLPQGWDWVVDCHIHIESADIHLKIGDVYFCFNAILEDTDSLTIKWNQFDGFMGTLFKGPRLFKLVSLKWDVVYI